MAQPNLLGLASLVALVSACAPVMPSVTAGRDFEWRRVESEHFVVEGNGGDFEALEAIGRDLELLYGALSQVPLVGDKPPRARTLVVVFDSVREFRAAGGKYAAVYFSQSALGPLILLPPRQGVFRNETLQHEVTHVLMGRQRLPRWMQEGLANVMQTARYLPEQSKVQFGHPSRHLLAFGRTAHDASIEELFAWTDETDPELYGASWILMHLLLDRHVHSLAKFAKRVGKGMPQAQAWRLTMPIPPDQVREAVRVYSRSRPR